MCCVCGCVSAVCACAPSLRRCVPISCVCLSEVCVCAVGGVCATIPGTCLPGGGAGTGPGLGCVRQVRVRAADSKEASLPTAREHQGARLARGAGGWPVGAGQGGSECGGGWGCGIPVCIQWAARGACFSLAAATGGRWEHTEQGLVMPWGGASLQMKPVRPAWGESRGWGGGRGRRGRRGAESRGAGPQRAEWWAAWWGAHTGRQDSGPVSMSTQTGSVTGVVLSPEMGRGGGTRV